MTLLSDCAELYHKTFVDVYFERVRQFLESKLQSADEKQLKKTTFKSIEEIVDMLWIKLMRRKAPEQERQLGKY